MQKSEPRNLFVYGTLRRGAQNEFARLLREQADLIGAGRVRGTLYDLDDYPGLVVPANTQRWVRGEVYRMKDRKLLAALDEYEGDEFERVTLDAMLDSG